MSEFHLALQWPRLRLTPAVVSDVEKTFRREKIQVLTNTRVKGLEEREVLLMDAKTKEMTKLPYGVCVWSTGIAPHTLTAKLIDKIEKQNHTKSLMVDSRLKVIGTNNIYAVGDCSVVQFPLLKDRYVALTYLSLPLSLLMLMTIYRLHELFVQTDVDEDGVLDENEFTKMFDKLVLQWPQLRVYHRKVLRLFHESDTNQDGGM